MVAAGAPSWGSCGGRTWDSCLNRSSKPGAEGLSFSFSFVPEGAGAVEVLEPPASELAGTAELAASELAGTAELAASELGGATV